MIGAKHLVVLFLGIEVLSIPLFVLAGSDKDNISGNEAALKYFLMGAFSSAIFLLGAAFLYGGSAVMTYQEMFLRLSFSEHFGDFPVLMKAGMILVMVGLLFKVSAVPFHFWSPDVYEGSPNRVTSFMAVIVKIAGFVALANFMKAFLPMLEWTSNWLLPISAITILGGNIAAFAQKSFKRMLAYSSISHAGYLLLFALTSMQDMSVLGTYLLAYGLSTALLFYLFDKYANGDKNGFEIFTGLTFTNRTDTIALVVATLSIAGIPGTIGFIGKYQLFSTAFGPQFWGVMIALLGSIISIGYYFKPFKYAFRTESDTPNQWNWSWGSICSVVISSVILALGLFPYLLSLYF
jgi:NADH-quinone oxidoreductase subunit N